MSKPSSKHTPQPVSSRTTYALGALALVLLAVIVFAVYRWNQGSDQPRNDGYGSVHDAAVSVALDSDGAIVLGKPGVAKTIEIFEDPICPACGNLERIYGQEIAQQLDEGKFAVRYRLVSFLDGMSKSKDYSTRAVAANECVAQAGDGRVYSKFHELLFTTKQPEERGNDHDNQALAAIAKEAGASDDVARCITGGQRIDTARNHAEAAMKALEGKLGDDAGTPSIFIDDKRIDWQNDNWVLDAAK
ncbi:DsbA family protein [Nocardia huaxiensis]|uniref:DsbA family protein n=1 Tax=Nocardia huaxiensis TaxID=2755382 RepID=A0A7D6Z6T7_9NOCA|nr:thioredoxin domain-containing protein [Nocardia huaxiensis]QLY33084.1 DsbA family protein [Nocardia huaxiensis]